METEKARVLLTALQRGSLSAAAEELGYTPSGVSRAIASLEEETGFALLRRGRWGVEATESCTQLLPQLRQLLSAEEALSQRMAALRGLDAGQLRFGTAYDSYSRALAQLIADFCRAHPGVRVDTRTGSSTALCRALEAGELDLCLVSRREGSFDWTGLRSDPLLAVIPASHPLSGAAAYPAERFAADRFIEILPGADTDNSRLFTALGLRPNVCYTAADDRSALALVEAGLGVTLVNAMLLSGREEGVRALPLSPPQSVEIGLAAPSFAHGSPVSAAFLAYLRPRLGAAAQG